MAFEIITEQKDYTAKITDFLNALAPVSVESFQTSTLNRALLAEQIFKGANIPVETHFYGYANGTAPQYILTDPSRRNGVFLHNERLEVQPINSTYVPHEPAMAQQKDQFLEMNDRVVQRANMLGRQLAGIAETETTHENVHEVEG